MVKVISARSDNYLRKKLLGLMENLKNAQSNFENEIVKLSTEQASFTQVSSPSKDFNVVNKK